MLLLSQLSLLQLRHIKHSNQITSTHHLPTSFINFWSSSRTINIAACAAAWSCACHALSFWCHQRNPRQTHLRLCHYAILLCYGISSGGGKSSPTAENLELCAVPATKHCLDLWSEFCRPLLLSACIKPWLLLGTGFHKLQLLTRWIVWHGSGTHI